MMLASFQTGRHASVAALAIIAALAAEGPASAGGRAVAVPAAPALVAAVPAAVAGASLAPPAAPMLAPATLSAAANLSLPSLLPSAPSAPSRALERDARTGAALQAGGAPRSIEGGGGESGAVQGAAVGVSRPLRLVMLGPPAAGKGTYSKLMARDYGAVHVSVGELLRAYAPGHPEVAAVMAQGRLVGTDLVLDLVRERLSREDVRLRGFILDGFPRRVEEARFLQSLLQELGVGLDGVVRLEAPEEELKRRVLARGRPDDSEAVFEERMRGYREETLPVYEFFQGKAPILAPAAGAQEVSAGYEGLRGAIEELRGQAESAEAGAAEVRAAGREDRSGGRDGVRRLSELPAGEELIEAGASLDAGALFEAAGREAMSPGRYLPGASLARRDMQAQGRALSPRQPVARRLRTPEAGRADVQARGVQAAGSRSVSAGSKQFSALFEAGKGVDREWLDAVIELALRSETGGKVLEGIRALVARRGKPIKVGSERMGTDLAQYDYIRDLVLVSAGTKRGAPAEAAASLIHELTHVLQHRLGVPAEALELELEAHVADLRVMRELGSRPGPGSFAAAAERELAKGPGAFIAWLAGQLPGKFLLLGSSFEAVEEALEDEAGELDDRLAGLEEGLARGRGGAAARARLERAAAIRAWVEADLRVVRSRAGRRAYRAFSRRALQAVTEYSLMAR